MGVGWTPLVPVSIFGRDVSLKLEFLSPSGSFKDRGVNAMVNQLVHMGAETLVEDSSGNAGASLAAHAARFGLKSHIYVPDYASQGKKHQISVYGASVIPIQGSRRDVEKAAQAAIGKGIAYASHAYHPAYLAGQVTAAYELWEQMEHQVPDWILCPVAQGGLFLGYWLGFSALFQAGLITKLPHLVAVQALRIAPIHQAFIHDLNHIPEVLQKSPTVAEGVAIAKPVRGKRILQALRETKGFTVAIEEPDILAAQEIAAHHGYYIEPTSALVIAGFKSLINVIPNDETIVLPLTGSGLKGMPKYA
jgi:threonine synthase